MLLLFGHHFVLGHLWLTLTIGLNEEIPYHLFMRRYDMTHFFKDASCSISNSVFWSTLSFVGSKRLFLDGEWNGLQRCIQVWLKRCIFCESVKSNMLVFNVLLMNWVRREDWMSFICRMSFDEDVTSINLAWLLLILVAGLEEGNLLTWPCLIRRVWSGWPKRRTFVGWPEVIFGWSSATGMRRARLRLCWGGDCIAYKAGKDVFVLWACSVSGPKSWQPHAPEELVFGGHPWLTCQRTMSFGEEIRWAWENSRCWQGCMRSPWLRLDRRETSYWQGWKWSSWEL
jgi:hypothetical protein